MYFIFGLICGVIGFFIFLGIRSDIKKYFNRKNEIKKELDK
jgi:hypothetical protein